MERRNFIKQSLITAGALSFSDKFLFASNVSNASNVNPMNGISAAEPSPYRKSIMWASVGMKGATTLEKCKAIKAAGFEGVEPSGKFNLQEMKDALKAAGLVTASVCTAGDWEKPMSSPDAYVRKESLECVVKALEDAYALGTDAILLVPGRVDENISYDDCWNRTTAGVKELIPIAEKLQVKICIENVWNNFLISPLDMCRYVDQFNSKYVGAYFDCGNIMVYGWPEQWIKILGDRIGRIHIKEFSKQIADKEGRGAGFRAKLTEGDVRWKEVMKAMRSNYKNVWLTTEQGTSNSLEDLKDLSARLDKIIVMY